MWQRIIIWFGLSVASLCLAQPRLPGSLKGTVIDEAGREPVRAVTLVLKSAVFSRTVTVDGAFDITNIPGGTYQLEVNAPGFASIEQEVVVPGGDTVTLELVLTPALAPIEFEVVGPSTFSLLKRPVASSGSYLDRETIRNTPKFGDDVYRALSTLPGTSSNDFSASFNVRGGEYREVLVTLDGMELINPFHLKDFLGVFSYIDPETLDGLNLTTGGYAANYGNAMSGVMEMTTVEPTTKRSSATLSLGNVGFRTEGTFAGGLGGYLFSGRRGYLDILLSFTEDDEEEEEQDITYYDSYGKLSYILSDKHKLSASYLFAGDDFLSSEMEEGDIEDANATYDDLYLWATLRSVWNDRLSSETVLYYGEQNQDRVASSLGAFEVYDFSDLREMDYQGLKQDWQWRLSDQNFLRFGFDVRTVDAVYRYRGEFENPVPIGVPEQVSIGTDLNPSGEEYAAYVTDRFRLGERWRFEVGLRYDRQTLLSDSQVSPRFNAAYRIDDRNTLRFAYGVYHQAERAHDLQVPDGVDAFSLPEKATHWLLGYERRFDNGIDLRVEAYLKDQKDLRTRFVNLTRSLNQYPGPAPDRVGLPLDSGEVRGLEIVLKQDLGGKLSWFANYAWSEAEDNIGDQTIPRPWDQEHTFNASLNYRPGRKWNFNLAWIYHTGWRTTPLQLVETVGENGAQEFDILPGDLFADTYPDYHRLDLRVNRSVFKSERRAFELFLDVFNLYNRENVRGFDEIEVGLDDNGQPVILQSEDTWLPVLPTFGFTWRF